jgi:hypothetical protein
VREIQAACLDIELFYIRYRDSFVDAISSVKKEHTDLNWRGCIEHYKNLEKAGIDIKLLEKVLSPFGLGLDHNNKNKPFATFKVRPLSPDNLQFDEQFKTKTLKTIDELDLANKGLMLYCALFNKLRSSSDDLLAPRIVIKPFYPYVTINFIKKPTDQHDKLIKDILEYVLKIKIPDYLKEISLITLNNSEYRKWLSELLAMVPSESALGEVNKKERKLKDNPFNMKEADLLSAYYRDILTRAGGNKKEAAKLAGLNKNTFYSRLKKAGI